LFGELAELDLLKMSMVAKSVPGFLDVTLVKKLMLRSCKETQV
jgi:hypothetical protein